MSPEPRACIVVDVESLGLEVDTQPACEVARFLGDLFTAADHRACFPPGELGVEGAERALSLREPWHHRLLDLAPWAASSLGFPGIQMPGLSKVCERLGVVNDDPHSALGDVRATAECLYRLGAVPRPETMGGAA